MVTTIIPSGRQLAGITDDPNFDLNLWPYPDEGCLSEDNLSHYLRRKTGVTLYFEGASDQQIFAQTGFGRKQIYRLIRERCMRTHSDGRVYGWRGLLKNFRINHYQRKKPIACDPWGNGAVGALNETFIKFPALKVKFERRILEAAAENALGERRRPRQMLWKWLINELQKLGCEARNEWPFNMARLGYVSISNHMDNVYKANPTAAARSTGGPDLAKKLKTGDGIKRPVMKPYQRVEADGYKIDGRFCIQIPQPTGGWSPKIVHRLWVLVIEEVVSRAVLGYYFGLGRELRKEDVLRAIQQALTRWRPKNITYSDQAYHPGAGFPSSHCERLVGACWDEFSVDGALVNTCKTVELQLNSVVHAQIISPFNSYAARRSKDDRPFIETFFRQLGQKGFQRLTNTTGSKPADKQGLDPGHVALTSEFQLEYAEELLDVLIANYNATPHSSLGYRSPLAYLDFMTTAERCEIRHASAEAVASLLSYRKLVTVKGGFSTGRQPYINLEGARYSSDWLRNRNDLCGQKIWVATLDADDIRVVRASTLDGIVLGNLRAQPPWHATPHSLTVRKAILSLSRRKLLHIITNSDAIEDFTSYVEDQPDHKLPIHPAYLEVRRILSAWSGKHVSDQESEQLSAEHGAKVKAAADGSKRQCAKASLDEPTLLPSRRKAIDF